jgi:hypothetical protein
MTNYTVVPSTTVQTTPTIASSIGGPTRLTLNDAAASTFTMLQGSFLISTGAVQNGLEIGGNASWTLKIDGHVSGTKTGVTLFGSSAKATVTVGEDATLRGGSLSGFYSDRPVALINKGVITSTDAAAINLGGAGATNIVTNSGIISGATFAIDSDNNGNDSITNSGEMYGGLTLRGGTDKVINSGYLAGNIEFGDGASSFDNKGIYFGIVKLGNGSNKLSNSGQLTDFDGDDSGAIQGGSADDTISNSKTGSIIGEVALGNGFNSFVNAGSVYGFFGSSNGDVRGGTGIDIITNSGTIQGTVNLGSGIGNKLTNSGRIEGMDGTGNSVFGGEGDAITNSKTGFIAGTIKLGDGTNTLTNAGTVNGGITSGQFGGSDVIVNSGTINSDIQLFAGNDILTNTGRIVGYIDLGIGNDTFKGGKQSESVVDNAGQDSYSLGDGNDEYLAFVGGEDSLADTVDGGKGTDNYYASNLASGALINLDSVDHVFEATTLTRQTVKAQGGNGNIDNVLGFEIVAGSAANDVIFGSDKTGDILNGNGGTDNLFGLGGNDTLQSTGSGTGTVKMTGGLGADSLYGANNFDNIFIYNAATESGITRSTRDTIYNFAESHDIIYLDGLLDEKFTGIRINQGFTGTGAAELRTYQTATGWMIETDTDGNGKADMSIAVIDEDHTIDWVFQHNNNFADYLFGS